MKWLPSISFCLAFPFPLTRLHFPATFPESYIATANGTRLLKILLYEEAKQGLQNNADLKTRALQSIDTTVEQEPQRAYLDKLYTWPLHYRSGSSDISTTILCFCAACVHVESYIPSFWSLIQSLTSSAPSFWIWHLHSCSPDLPRCVSARKVHSMFHTFQSSAGQHQPAGEGDSAAKPTRSIGSRRISTSNACIECRRRKIRCDGTQPCGQCQWYQHPEVSSSAP